MGVFWGGETIFWAGHNTISTLFILNFQFKLAILYLKFQKCQIPGPGKCLLLPIGADAHDSDFTFAILLLTIIICLI